MNQKTTAWLSGCLFNFKGGKDWCYRAPAGSFVAKPLKKFLTRSSTCLLAVSLHAQTTVNSTIAPVSSETLVGYQIGAQDGNSRHWQKIVRVTDARGNFTVQTNLAYVELASGLNYWDESGQQWLESKEEIDAYADGAIAQYGQHKVIFANNLNTIGAIDLQTPDGKELKSHVLGLGYYDSASGKSVLFAQTKDCQGQIAGGNQVVYADAFEGIHADVRYTYKRGSFEQDVILEARPPAPESFGLNSQTAVLQVLTEFDTAPEPSIKAAATLSADGLADQCLDFGAMKMVRGRAFGVRQNPLDGVRVSKQWQNVNGRTILIESLPVASITNQLNGLAMAGSSHRHARTAQRAAAGKNSNLNIVSSRRLLPAPQLAKAARGKMKLARISPVVQGLVLDYVTVSGSTGDYTFQSDTTYYVTGGFIVGGTVYLEGGTVIKYDEGSSYPYGGIYPYAGFQCQTSPYRPAIITSANDNSVGETISGSTGNPSRYHCSALDFDVSPTFTGPMQYLHIRYAAAGLTFDDVTPAPVRHCQFINVGDGVQNYDSGTVTVENCLFSGVSGYVLGADDYPWAIVFTAANLTVHQANNLITTNVTLNVTNSLFICVTNWGHTFTGAFNATNSSDAGVFASGPFGNEYLATNSYRNIGTTNIDPALLSDLRQTTTYTPAAGSWPDTDTPDLGFHYPIINSTGTDFWMAFLNMDGGTPSLYISSATATTGTVTFAGILINGPAVTVSGCRDWRVNGTYYLTNTSGAEAADGIIGNSIYVKGMLQVGFSDLDNTWVLFNYNSGTDTYTWLYDKQTYNPYNASGNDWEIDSLDGSTETNLPPPTTSGAVPLTESFVLAAGQVTNMVVPNDFYYPSPFMTSGMMQTNGIEVIASQPVSVYAMESNGGGSTAINCYPLPLLGTNYCVLARPSLDGYASEASELGIVATESNTTVTITPSATANLVGISTPSTNIVLQQGQTYQFQSSDDTGDVTGTRVTANQPIVVFAGDNNAFVPGYPTGAGNPLVQQQLPVEQWGTNAVSHSFAGREKGDTYRVLAVSNDTVVTITMTNGTIVVTNQAGQFYEKTNIDGPVWFQATKPIQVAQFANGDDFDNPPNFDGDPCEILLPPIGHYLTTSIVITPDGFDTNYLNIIVPQSGTNTTYLDDSLLASAYFVAIGASGYYSAQITITNTGAHIVTSSQPVGVEVYGWGYYDAYGYFGGIVK